MSIFAEKLKEVVLSVIPVVGIVLWIHALMTPLTGELMFALLSGAVLVIVGLTLFLIGVDLGMEPLGANISTLITKQNRLWLVIAGGLLLGFFVSMAEPDLMILAQQIEEVTSGLIGSRTILYTVSFGIASLLVVGFVRVLYNVSLRRVLIPAYLLVLVLAILSPPAYLGIAFDAGGVATGPMTATFILAVTQGIADAAPSADLMLDGFGMIAMVAMMPILTLQVQGLIFKWKMKREEA